MHFLINLLLKALLALFALAPLAAVAQDEGGAPTFELRGSGHYMGMPVELHATPGTGVKYAFHPTSPDSTYKLYFYTQQKNTGIQLELQLFGLNGTGMVKGCTSDLLVDGAPPCLNVKYGMQGNPQYEPNRSSHNRQLDFDVVEWTRTPEGTIRITAYLTFDWGGFGEFKGRLILQEGAQG